MAAYCLTATVPQDRYDLLLFQFHNLGMLGCEERDAADGVTLLAYFKDEGTARTAAQTLNTADSRIEKVEDRDWIAKWRESIKPARLAAGWYVSPAWLRPTRSARHWIKIEPKMAFGTGHHETTRLAAQAIISLKNPLKSGQFLDIGTGSGVLCFVARLCGASRCTGIEIDPDCRGNLVENHRLNGGKTGFVIGSSDSLKGLRSFDVIAMNMLITESAPLLGVLSGDLLKPSGIFIWSGILFEERRQAVKTARKSHLSLAAEKKENEWWCGVFRRT